MGTDAGRSRRRLIRVSGIVQGVGYRPFVYGVASRLGVRGHVGNDSDGVFVEAEGSAAAVAEFVRALREDAPPLAQVDAVEVTELAPTGAAGFVIVRSRHAEHSAALVTPDSATCADCLRELADPSDRRYLYAFTNCTNCGPRFTITRAVPYDRPNTTMARFAMCLACHAEYVDPADRRFHAQPVCCPACGPQMYLRRPDGEILTGVIGHAARMLRDGAVLAVKGLGGYHLAARADDERAVSALRTRKHREDKPFAIMVGDLKTARLLCAVDDAAARLLLDRARPIVLLARRSGAPVAPSVAPGNRELGLLLPYTPLHRLLADAVDAPFVLTSGNVSDEPIAYRDDDAQERLTDIADGFLVHDRPIHIRTDDSVVRIVRGSPMLLRRSRGYVPAPLPVPIPACRPGLACGAELKSTFCLVRGGHAFVSHHIGDLENVETLRSFTDGIAHFQQLLDIRPHWVTHDLHPEYLSTKHALAMDDVDLLGVQHHHAHIASCLADNGETGPVIGVACDGTGYGPDGVLWGGEVLVADLHGYERVAHLGELPLPGGATAIRQPWRMAVSYLVDAYGAEIPPVDLVRRHEPDVPAVAALSRSRGAVRTTSTGRLFDAVAALVGVRDTVNYEGQAAIELEQWADPGVRSRYPMTVADGVLRGADLVCAVVDDLDRRVPVPTIAARFHRGLAVGWSTAVSQVRDRTGLTTVALSGGVFQNRLLLTELCDLLEDDGFRVLTHHRIPPNDGGISLGQAAIGAARDSASPCSGGNPGG